MILIPSPEKMSQLEKYIENEPVMLQEFIQHDGVIVKVYVADGQITASTRPSFKNLDTTGDVVHFDSQTLPKSFETKIELSDDLDKIFLRTNPGDILVQKESLLDNDRLKQIADGLYRQLVSYTSFLFYSHYNLFLIRV
jgi:inositol-1,3,4-trisphosphate 5/6-kinase/inositol-tetrakisphosphate 1-kinase